MKTSTLVLAAVLLLSIGTTDAIAWGCDGHRAIVFIAERLLAPAALAAARATLAASPVDRHLFVMTRKSAPQPGVVVWFDGAEVDRFPSFDEFFLAMMDYNREEIQALRGSPKS